MLNKENQENYYSNKLELVGPSFEELSLEEMEAIQGSGDVHAETTPKPMVKHAETTPACFTIGLGVGALFSAKFC
ncbi:type 2 lantibiotic [Enterococcus faecalis]|nr:type 2 lantibiotic [Enterococcus faecalis]